MLKFATMNPRSTIRESVITNQEAEDWLLFCAQIRYSTASIPMSRGEFRGLPLLQRTRVKDVASLLVGPTSDGTRKVGSISEVYFLSIDFEDISDEVQFLYQIISIFADRGYIIYRTANYTKEVPRYRLITPLERPTPYTEYENAYQALIEHVRSVIPAVLFDSRFASANSPSYLPTCFLYEDISDIYLSSAEDLPKSLTRWTRLID